MPAASQPLPRPHRVGSQVQVREDSEGLYQISSGEYLSGFRFRFFSYSQSVRLWGTQSCSLSSAPFELDLDFLAGATGRKQIQCVVETWEDGRRLMYAWLETRIVRSASPVSFHPGGCVRVFSDVASVFIAFSTFSMSRLPRALNVTNQYIRDHLRIFLWLPFIPLQLCSAALQD